MLVDIK